MREIERCPEGSMGHVRLHHAKTYAETWLSSVVQYRCDNTQLNTAESRLNQSLSRSLRIGLVGRHTCFGLAHQNRDIAAQLAVERWLSPDDGPAPTDLSCQFQSMSRPMSQAELEAWMTGLDVIVFVESPVFEHLTKVARGLNVRVVCIPNWEWLHPGMDWLHDVALMLCPTVHESKSDRTLQSRLNPATPHRPGHSRCR